MLVHLNHGKLYVCTGLCSVRLAAGGEGKGRKRHKTEGEEEEGEVDMWMLIKWGRLAGYLGLLGDIQKVVPCSDADKPVGSCGAWRGVCYKQRDTSVYMLLHTHIHTQIYIYLIYTTINLLRLLQYICQINWWERVRDTDSVLVTWVICSCCGQVHCYST